MITLVNYKCVADSFYIVDSFTQTYWNQPIDAINTYSSIFSFVS